ncbi:hypothetical protein ACFC09_00065 [Streptomyces sp. NPDC056161]|uniref:hypothetical protein n=1 Tax=Streptomyces sp. NPDC056161 TaxID=3345732 RepID=UPI0035DB69C5
MQESDLPVAEADSWSRIPKLRDWEQRKRDKAAQEAGSTRRAWNRVASQLLRARRILIKDENLQQSVAKDVYEAYQPLLKLPEEPPAGMGVALAWTSLGLSGVKPLVVPLNPSDGSVTSVIADLLLNLRDPRVQNELRYAKGLDEQVCATALGWQDDLKSWLGVEASGNDAQPDYPRPMFSGVNVDAFCRRSSFSPLGVV